MAVERALISVFDKAGIVEFAKWLATLKIEILSTGGTAKLLREAGVSVRDVSDFTGWPEMLGGRVKTLHPKVHGGLLFRRKNAEDQKQAAEHGIAPIDLVVANLYPFEATAAKAGLKGGDLLVEFDGKQILTLSDYAYALRTKKPGDIVAVVVKRNGQDVKTDVTLEARR